MAPSPPSRSARTARIEIQCARSPWAVSGLSRSARTARIEMPPGVSGGSEQLRRGPQGPRGLKYLHLCKSNVWEIGRGPQGPRGLKYGGRGLMTAGRARRGPQGPRGLKFFRLPLRERLIMSRSARTARIEITIAEGSVGGIRPSRSARTARIEIHPPLPTQFDTWSRSARTARIEIGCRPDTT